MSAFYPHTLSGRDWLVTPLRLKPQIWCIFTCSILWWRHLMYHHCGVENL